MCGLFTIVIAFVLVTSPPLELHELSDLGYALAAMLGWTIAGSAVGAAFGVLFQAIANAMIRRASKKTSPAS